jgi:hypothetical protein
LWIVVAAWALAVGNFHCMGGSDCAQASTAGYAPSESPKRRP